MSSLVTGSSGFLGSALCRLLLEMGEPVRGFDLVASADARVESFVGDLRDPGAVQAACEGVDVVFHVASLVSQELGKPQALFGVNVTGTQTLIEAASATGASRFVFTSSIDVVFDGHAISGGDERLPYARKYLDYYGETKAMAERLALSAHGLGGMATCALRPAGIYGPGDRQRFLPVVRAIQAGQYRRIGDGSSRFNHVYVDNVAFAHVLAAQHLGLDGPVGGEAYFVTDYAPSSFFDFVEAMLTDAGLEVPEGSVPAAAAQALAVANETRFRLSPSVKNATPTLSRYVVASTTRDFWFTHDKATRDFGYQPIVSQADARKRTVRWLRQVLANERLV
ncbi:MAG TPA: NAD-dependent epimerase/dehydratase family protein [Candidatus Limnocylindrales bacterium]|nr:NAD-dependent epimerase/dehydratase family protein [Candidatus Limnocylindrales bacterium]